MTFGGYMALGLRHGAYVLGLLTTLGGFAAVVGLVCALVGYLANPEKDDDKEDDDQ